jgi:Domain of unknown function (DUF4259)
VGTWGEGAFDNDTAADWSHEFDRADLISGMRLIEDALGRAAGTAADDYLDGQDGDQAVAAAELVACIAGQPVAETAYNATAFGWAYRVNAEVGRPLLDLACQALVRVTGEGSESAELWDEGPSTWRESVAELAAKLQDARRAVAGPSLCDVVT